MDRRSWLWARKSSEKSPGETESSGSISSHSERFSDDQVYTTHSSQSPEVTSKSLPNDEETNDTVKTLKEKLSSALLSITAKEELVKQHSKVAEEAVSGWEKVGDEVVALKQQLEAATQKNSLLEDRVLHLDGALKECVRQLRQAREEREQKIREWESTKSALEAKLETASFDPHLHSKIEVTEKENLSLRLELFSKAKELKMAILERDWSTRAAEAASKQHLEDMRKASKLEAECQRLKSIISKAIVETDARRVVMSEPDQSKKSNAPGRNHAEMDFFLEMERLAGETESSTEIALKAELEAMIHRTAELEERLEYTEEENSRLADQLEASRGQVKEAELNLRRAQDHKRAAETELGIVKAEVGNLHSKIGSLEEELLKEKGLRIKNLAKCKRIEDEINRERTSGYENLEKCRKLEEEVLRMKRDAESHQELIVRRAAESNKEMKIKQEKELVLAASKFAECQRTIASLGGHLKSLAFLEDLLIDEKSPELAIEAAK